MYQWDNFKTPKYNITEFPKEKRWRPKIFLKKSQ